MRIVFHRILAAAATLAASATFAQTHKVAKPEQVVRAVGVYEWTGDFAKPTASRLIPVSVYIEGKFEDAGVYTARPVPFALLSGNVYILQSAGIDKGTLDLAYAKHLQAVEATGDLAYDDGWFGYGSVKPLAAPRNTTHALKPSKNVPVIATSSDPNRPHLVTKNSGTTSGDAASQAGDPSKPTGTSTASQTTTQPDSSSGSTSSGTKSTATGDADDRPTMKRRDSSASTTTASSSPSVTSTGSPSDDPDRPTMKRRDTTTSGTDSSTTASTQTGSTPSDDPDRPTMKRHDTSGSTTTSGSDTSDTSTTTASTPSSSPDDPDRPTLKRRSAGDPQRGTNTSVPGVSAVGSLNDDPNRPNLHHGKPTSSMNETDLPKLTGLPPNLHQMVAVSDAANRDPHPFTLTWDDEAQHQAILTKIQEMAHAQLAAYSPLAPTTPSPATAKRPPATQARTKKPAPPPPQPPLLDEELKAYTLSYGGAPTYVYSANTGGTGVALRYITIVAQDDGLGNIKPAIQSVTDAAHLDRTPKMQFVDVVDAEASNRASLLFELRSHSVRQFALYRVIASHSEQIFLTGTTQ